MSELHIFPIDIAEMSLTELAALPPEIKFEVDSNLNAAVTWLIEARAKFNKALDRCYGEQARAALNESGRDFGIINIVDGPLHIKFEQAKEIEWNQKQLREISEHILASGENPENYLDIRYAVCESRYINWPPAFQKQFATARTTSASAPSFILSCEPSDEGSSS